MTDLLLHFLIGGGSRQYLRRVGRHGETRVARRCRTKHLLLIHLHRGRDFALNPTKQIWPLRPEQQEQTETHRCHGGHRGKPKQP